MSLISERSFCLFWDSGADIKFQKYRKAGNFKMETKIKDAETDFLFKAILSLDSLEECYAFFEDLCTVSEIKEMSKRITAARMLNENYIYSTISEKTGLSTATISRVNRCLKYGNDGYAEILNRVERRK